MAFDFPNSPSVGQTFQGYTWDGEKWVSTAAGPNIGGVLRTVVFTASGTYVPSANMTTCVMETVGGGAGGGGVAGALSQAYSGAGGGSGGYSRTVATAATVGASQAVTIGAAGAGGAAGANVGVAGGMTSIGSLCIANGGGGADFASAALVPKGGPGGVSGTGDLASPGNPGGNGFYNSAATSAIAASGAGASSFFGGGARAVTGANNPGGNATGYGAGGSGAIVSNTTANNAGGNGSPGLAVITEYGMTSLSASTIAQGAVRFDLPQGLTAPQQKQARDNIAAILHGHLFGLTLSTAGSSATFSVAPGVAADSTSFYKMTLAAAISKTTAAWAVGSGNGALDTGAIAASTWYHIHLIQRSDTGVVDVLISLSATAPTLPANYTAFRRIGSMKTNASSQWALFTQRGDEFYWPVPFFDVSASQGVASVTYVLSGVPLGVVTKAILNAASFGNNVIANIYIRALTESDPTNIAFTAGNAGYQLRDPTTTGGGNATQLQIWTDANQQIAAKASVANVTLNIMTVGYIDRRGKDN